MTSNQDLDRSPEQDLVHDLATDLTGFEDAMLDRVETLGLPREGVLISVESRVHVLDGLEGAILQLPRPARAVSIYLSKFAMAVSAGLFDAALNYLWDETVSELRKRIVGYDLAYFFDLAVSDPDKRKQLEDPEDLEKLTDDELIRAAATVGFISALGQRQLDLVRFMRNHASAAHPNQHQLSPYQLLGYVETCIKEVITLPESQSMIDTSRLLANVKKQVLIDDEADDYTSLFEGLREDQLVAVGNGLFGIYVRPDSSTTSRDNVRILLPHLWPLLPESAKAAFGVRFSRFKGNLDLGQAELAREFLEAVGASSYLPEDERAADISKVVDRLEAAHVGWDNFYHEPPVARELDELVGQVPVPLGVRERYVEVLVNTALGRSSGVAWAANPIYHSLFSRMTPEEAGLALLQLTSQRNAAKLSYKEPRRQFDAMVDALEPKLVGRRAKALLEAVRNFTGPREAMILDSGITRKRDRAREELAQ